MLKKFIAEFIGTFFLVLTIGLCTTGGGAGNLAPIGIGAVLAAMIFSMGHISSAHYNPAVTLAFWVRGRLPTREVPVYLAAEILGGVLGAVAATYINGIGVSQGAGLGADPTRWLLAEFLFTFALAWVIMNVATANALAANQFYGVAIAATVIGGAYAAGGISGAAFNPAVSLAACFMHSGSWAQLPMFVVVQLLAGACAGLLFRQMFARDK